MKKIERFKTEIEVEELMEDVTHSFPAKNTITILNVYHFEEKIFTTRYLSNDIRKLVQSLEEAGVQDITYEFTEEDGQLNLVRLGDYTYLASPRDGHTVIEITTYSDDIDAHYDKVNEAKAKLLNAGFHVKDAQCELTQRVRC